MSMYICLLPVVPECLGAEVDDTAPEDPEKVFSLESAPRRTWFDGPKTRGCETGSLEPVEFFTFV